MATLQPGEKARMYAIGGVARGGATRGGYVSGQVFVAIDGVHRGFGRTGSVGIILDSLQIMDSLDETPNRCTFRLNGVAETTGGEIVITLGTKNSLTRWFAGYITNTSQIYVGQRPANLQTECAAIDYTWLLTFLTVTGRYTSQSATAIIQNLITTYAAATGFTAKYVAAGLPVLDEITFTEEELPDAITRIMRRIGGYWYVDYDLHVHAFVGTEAVGVTNGDPEILTAQHRSLANFAYDMDRSQVITRAHVEGRGSRLLSHVLIGDTMLPLETVEMFETGSDVYLKASFQGSEGGASYLTFTGRVQGGAGSLVGPGIGPPAAPTPYQVGATGLSVGLYSYAYTFVTATGETLPSPLGQVYIGQYIGPGLAPIVERQPPSAGVDAGSHLWAYTYVTTDGGGETTLSSVSETLSTAAPITPTGGISAFNVWSGGVLVKDRYYGYKVTYVGDAGGETTGAALGASIYTMSPNNKPEIFVGDGGSQPVYAIPLGVTHVKFYRTQPTMNGAYTTYYHVGTVAVSAGPIRTAVFMDTVPDASLVNPLPTTNTASTQCGKVRVTTIVSPDTRVNAVKIYRTAANTTSPFKLVAQIACLQGGVQYMDTLPDASLGAVPPSTNTAGQGWRATDVYDIAVGPAAVTQRKLYRTIANGSQLKLQQAIANNTVTAVNDRTADGALGANAPTSDTSGLAQQAGQVPAGVTTIPVANPGAFQAGGGWAVIGNGEQVVRYTGLTGNTLTGIPATGIGAVTAAITFNSTITMAAMLTGIPASGTRAITGRNLTAGDEIYLVVVSNDTTKQAALAADLHRGTGIRETWIQDRRLSVTEARARGVATLALYPLDDLRVTYTCRDLRTRAGKTITVNLPAPTNVAGSYKIQQVQIGNFRPHGEQYPTFTVEASSRQFSFEDLLRRTKLKE